MAGYIVLGIGFDMMFKANGYGLLFCIIVAALHVWKRNSILSIAGGTAVYMIIINFL